MPERPQVFMEQLTQAMLEAASDKKLSQTRVELLVPPTEAQQKLGFLHPVKKAVRIIIIPEELPDPIALTGAKK